MSKQIRFDRITSDPDQMGEVPCIRGLRIPVVTVARMANSGMTVNEVLLDYPDLEEQDIDQAIRFVDALIRLSE